MRWPLALFVAFAIVFAPGVDREPESGPDLAAHMLAPSVHEGAVQDVRSAVEEALAAFRLRIARGALHLAASTASLSVLAAVWLEATRRAPTPEDAPRCLCGPPLRAPPAHPA